MVFSNDSHNFSSSHLQCLFSYQTLTRRSDFPDVANSVPSGLNAIWWTGVAVWHFHTHSHPGSAIGASSAVGVRGSRSPISNVTATQINVQIKKKLFQFYGKQFSICNSICTYLYNKNAHNLTYTSVLRRPLSISRTTFRFLSHRLANGYLPSSMKASWCASSLVTYQFEPIWMSKEFKL